MMDIRTYLSQGKPLLFDGAMDTYFAAHPGRAKERCERVNLTRPEEILHIHRAYLQASCWAIKTSTFTISRDLSDGDDETAYDIVNAACHLARQAAQPYGAYISADLGSTPHDHNRAPADLYQTQARWFLEQGVAHFLMETLSGDERLPELADWLGERNPNAFLMVSSAVDHSGMTGAGRLGSELCRFASELTGVDAVGFNCVSGPRHLPKYIQTLELSGKPLTVMPNVGYLTVLGRRTVFDGQPDYFAGQIAQIVQAGASIVGGCCGTTPEHIAQTAQTLKEPLPKCIVSASKKLLKPATNTSNSLWKKLETGKRAVAVELNPPIDDDSAGFWEGVRALWGSGASAVTIADCPIGRPRADNSLLACKIKRNIGIGLLPHMTCRDRNLDTTEALLLGLPMERVHNVLVVTGGPISTGNRNEVKGVFNFNSRRLACLVHMLNENTLCTPFRIYGALSLNTRNFDVELRRAQEKEAYGVSDFLTQPALSAEVLGNLRLVHKTLRSKILSGIFPVVNHRNACFLNNETSDMRARGEITHLYEGKDRDIAEALTVTISTVIAKEIFPYTDGYYLMTPFRRMALMEHIIQNIQQSCIS